MTLLMIMIAALAVMNTVLIVCGSGVLAGHRRTAVRRRVLVNLLSGRAVEGVLVRRDGPLVVLKDAHLHEPGAEPAAVDGDVVIERAQIDFIQAL